MATNAGTAFIDVVADPKSFGPSLNKAVTSQTASIGSKISSIGQKLGGMFGVALGGAALFKLGKDAIAQAEQAQTVAAQTAAVLESTGGAANVTAEQVAGLAKSLGDVAAVDDEVIAQGENVLLTFTNIHNELGEGNDIFNQATAAALDLSAAMGTDLQSAIVLVGKALNDPIKGLTALRRVGVSFTSSQEDMIKSLVEAGDTLGAQKIILGELRKEFGGAAAANVTASKRLGVAFGNIEETLGGLLLPLLDSLATVLAALGPALQFVADNALPIVAAFLAFKSVTWLPALFTKISAGLENFSRTSKFAQGDLSGLSSSLIKFGGAAVIGLAIAGFQQLSADAKENADRIRESAAAIRDGTLSIQEFVAQAQVMSDLAPDWAKGTLSVENAVKAVNAEMARQEQIAADLYIAQQTQVAIAGAAAFAQDALADALLRSIDPTLQWIDSLAAAGDEADRSASATDDLAASMRALNDEFREAWALENQAAGGLVGLAQADADAADARRTLAAAQAKVNTLTANGKKGTAEYAQAVRDRNAAELDSISAQANLEGQAQSLYAEFRKGNVTLAEADSRLRAQAQAAGLSAGQTNKLVAQVNALYKADKQIPQSVITTYLANGLAGNLADLAKYNQYLASLDGKQVYITVHTNYVETGARPHGGVQ